MKTLNSHPEIELGSERLNPENNPAAAVYMAMPPGRYGECLDYLEGEAPPAGVLWKGCKILLPHLEQAGEHFAEALLDRIERRGGRCLLLIRRDLLAARVSQDLANLSGRWHVHREDQREGRTMESDPEVLWARLDRSWKLRRRIREGLSSRAVPILDLVYEEMFRALPSWLRRIAAFLQVSPRLFRLDSEIRGNPRPPREVLANYSRVAERLRRDPRFASFVESPARKESNG